MTLPPDVEARCLALATAIDGKAVAGDHGSTAAAVPHRDRRKPLTRPPAQTEDDFQAQVIELAGLHGWSTAHFRAARTARGWRTPVAGDGKGFVDLVLARPGGPVLFVELKADKGRLSPEQEGWRTLLLAAGADVRTWRPRDWPAVRAALTAEAAATPAAAAAAPTPPPARRTP